MARSRLEVDESKIIKKNKQPSPHTPINTPIQQEVEPSHVQDPPISMADGYKLDVDNAAMEISAHKHDLMFKQESPQGPPQNSSQQVTNEHTRLVYNFIVNKRRVKFSHGSLRPVYKTKSITYTDTIQELLTLNQHEIYKTEVEIEVHKRLINQGTSHILESRLYTFEENLQYLKTRATLLQEILGEAGVNQDG